VARTGIGLRLSPANAESTAIRWWPVEEVAALRLHRGFAATWPSLRGLLDVG
jgi:8-oxo-dGTP diphosphatase